MIEEDDSEDENADDMVNEASAEPPTAEHKADVARERGNNFFREGKWKEAINSYSDSVECKPTANAFANRAICHLKQGPHFSQQALEDAQVLSLTRDSHQTISIFWSSTFFFEYTPVANRQFWLNVLRHFYRLHWN